MVDVLPESRQALKLAADFARRAVGELERETEVDADAHEEPLVGEMVSDEQVPPDGENIIDVELEGDTGKKRWFFQAS
jgi:triacylglycerol lipase